MELGSEVNEIRMNEIRIELNCIELYEGEGKVSMKEREKESCRDVGWKGGESGGKVNCNERMRNSSSFFTILPSLLFSLFFVLFSGFFLLDKKQYK
jgi:hypothetical protein